MLAVSSCRKLGKLSRKQLVILVQVLFLLPSIALSIKVFGFRRIYAVLAKLSRKKGNLAANYRKTDAKWQALTTARIVAICSRYGLYRPNCLQKSLVLWWLLQNQGIESELRIGVRKQDDRLEAHAWVEYQGCVLNDSGDVKQRFAAFAQAISPLGVEIS